MIMIETERLCIRNFTPEDWQAIQAVIVHDQASESAKYEPPWPTATEEVQGMATWCLPPEMTICASA